MERGSEPERKAQRTDVMSRRDLDSYGLTIMTMATVIICGFVLYYSVPGNLERMVARNERTPAWLLVGALSLLPVLIAWFLTRYSVVLGIALGSAFVPASVATVTQRLTDPDPAWIGPVRGIGIVYTLCVAFAFVVILGRRFVELDRVLFTEATSIAFFATLLFAGGYAALEAHLDLPRLSFGWVPLIGLGVWGLCAVVFKRRMS